MFRAGFLSLTFLSRSLNTFQASKSIANSFTTSFSAATCNWNCRKMSADSKAHHYQTHDTIVWADCEMTGLDISKDTLLEVAVILTDSNLNEVASLGPLIIKTEKSVLDGMDKWCVKTHTKSGLVAKCLESQISVEDVDEQLYELLSANGIDRHAVLAGNSIGYDRIFLSKFCPKFSSLLHYRNIDVSSFKEVLRRWYPNQELFKKRLTHRALDDIRESIAELQFYQQKYFKDVGEVSMLI